MKTISLSVLLLFVLLFAYCGNDQDRKIESDTSNSGEESRNTCSEETARIIGRLIYFANPLEIIDNYARLEAFVNGNRNLFLPGSQVIQCMQMAGNRLIARGISAYSSEDADRAYSSALGMGATGEMANTIRTNFSQNATELFGLGNELLWLSQVIPEGAQGDWNDFLTTGTEARIAAIHGIHLMAPMLDQFDMILLQQAMAHYGPYMEYQTAVLVYFSTR